jgi:hypothetical protein
VNIVSDMGARYGALSKANVYPDLLTISTRLQALYTAADFEDSALHPNVPIDSMMLRLDENWGNPNINWFDVRVRAMSVPASVTDLVLQQDEAASSNSSSGLSTLFVPAADMDLDLLSGPKFMSYSSMGAKGDWFSMDLDNSWEWNGEDGLLLDVSFRTGPRRSDPVPSGNIAMHLESVHSRCAYTSESSSGQWALGKFFPSLKLIQSQSVQLRVGGVGLAGVTGTQSSIELDVSLNGGEVYIGQELASLREKLTFSLVLTGVSITAMKESSSMSALKEALASILGVPTASLHVMDVAAPAGSPGGRLLASAPSSEAFIDLVGEAGMSDSLPISGEELGGQLDDAIQSGALNQALVLRGIPSSVVGMSRPVSVFSPMSSIIAGGFASAVYSAASVKLGTVVPTSGTSSGGMTVAITGDNFFAPLDGIIYVRWLLDGQSQSQWISTLGYFEAASGDIVTSTPILPDSYLEDQGYFESELIVSFNGQTFTPINSATYFTFYKTPTIHAIYLEDDSGRRVESTPQSGKVIENGETVQIHSVIRGSNVFLRQNVLVCVFHEVGTAEDALDGVIPFQTCERNVDCLVQYASRVQLPDDGTWMSLGLTPSSVRDVVYPELNFSCPVPAVDHGTVLLAFSNNRYIGHDVSQVDPDVAGGVLAIQSEQCKKGTITTDPSLPCESCGAGTYELNGEVCMPCPRGQYQPSSEMSGCEACPADSHTDDTGSTARTDCRCQAGFYPPTLRAGDSCQACPADAFCVGGELPPYPIHGYRRLEEDLNLMLSCIPPTACPGGEENACVDGFTGTHCENCSTGYYRLTSYCATCPPDWFVGMIVPLQVASYFIVCILFVHQFATISKLGSWQVIVRFMQTTFILLGYELSWNGYFDQLYVQSAGKLIEIDFNVHDTNFYDLTRFLSPLMPLFFYPDFTATAAAECPHSPSYWHENTGLFFFAWAVPLFILLYAARGWLRLRQWRPDQSRFSGSLAAKVRKGNYPAGSDEVEVTGAAAVRHKEGRQAMMKLKGTIVGLGLCLLPYFLMKWLRFVSRCDAEDAVSVGVSCVPSSLLSWAGMGLTVLALLSAGVYFLDDSRKDGPFAFLCKSKTHLAKRWDFYTHARMCALVLAGFLSSSGVFQAGFGLSFLLLCLVAHAFSLPYKSARTNALETLCLLSNITMLFLGMLGAVGGFPMEEVGYGVQQFGYFLFFTSFAAGGLCLTMEIWDRQVLTMTKRGMPVLTFRQFLCHALLPRPLTRWLQRRQEEEQGKDGQQDALVAFVGQSLEVLLPRRRDGSNPFEHDGDITFPETEIMRLLFSHAALKRDLLKVRRKVWEQHVLLVTRALFLAVFRPRGHACVPAMDVLSVLRR